MDSQPILPRLYAGTVKPREFTHRDHLQAGWECHLSGAEDEPQRLASSLRALAERAGAPERYSATITGAFLALIGSAMRPRQPFEAFLEDNPGLMDRRCLLRHYSRERLSLREARTRFLMPDRAPLPPSRLALCGVETAASGAAEATAD